MHVYTINLLVSIYKEPIMYKLKNAYKYTLKSQWMKSMYITKNSVPLQWQEVGC